jgi:hypothetical protein
MAVLMILRRYRWGCQRAFSRGDAGARRKPGYKDQQFIVTGADDAKQEIARCDLKLVKQ